MSMIAITQGFSVGAGLIIAIGAQNAFVIGQGLKRQHVFLTAITCSLVDLVLISLGVFGVGAIFQLHPLMIEIARWFGAVFLIGYGLFSFRSAFHPAVLKMNALKKAEVSKKKIFLLLLGLGFLNPHAYLDAVVLIGSISAQHPGNERYYFGVGAILASFVWFFTIAYGARVLTPIFQKEKAWRILDIIIGVTMLTIATMLVLK